jgi:hypothetical protein
MAPRDRHLRSWLHVADHSSWHDKPFYSLPLAHALAGAYDQIHYAQIRVDPYFSAFRKLAPFRNQLVCAEQRLNLEFALALAFAGDDCPSQAIDCLSTAWEVAEDLRDCGAQAEIGYLAGALWQGAGQFLDAYATYQDAITVLHRLERNGEPVDPAFELNLVLLLAGCALDLGWLPVCLRHLDQAHALRSVWAPDVADQAASLAWLDAQLARYTGEPARALNLAGAAADLLLTHGRPINRGRAHTLVAESALDTLQLMLSPSSNVDFWKPRERVYLPLQLSPSDLLTRARTAATLALEVAMEIGDPIGATMARLALRRAVRLSHLRRQSESGVASAEKLLRGAYRLADPSLLGRAETALADELIAAGQVEAARATYYRSMRRLEEHYQGSLAFWPRLALQQLARESN